MVSAISSALSGLDVSSKRLEVSANNIANQFSTKTSLNGQVYNTPYKPKHVDQVSLSNGGVQAKVHEANTLDPQGSVTVNPSSDQAEQLIQQNIASYDFKANLKTLKTQDHMLKNLLDILS